MMKMTVSMVKKYIKSTFEKIYNSIPYAIFIIIILYFFSLDSYVSIIVTFISEYLNIDFIKKNIIYISSLINKILLLTIGFILKDIINLVWNKIKKKRIKEEPSWRYSIWMENFNLKRHSNISNSNIEKWLKQKKVVDYYKKKLEEKNNKNIVHDLRSKYLKSLYKLNKIEERCNKDLKKLNNR